MPTVISSKKGGKPNAGKPKLGAKNAATPAAIVVAVLLTLGFFIFMYHKFVNPITNQQFTYEKVPPPPGYPDQFPYNMKKWQEETQNGTSGRGVLSGTPPASAVQAMNQGRTPSGGGAAPQ